MPSKLSVALLPAMAFLAFILASPIVSAQALRNNDAIAAEMKTLVDAAMKAGNIPSMSVALVDRDGVIWSEAFGYANVLKKVPADTETVYLIGSTFKAQSAMALLQLVDQGKVDLDKPASQYMDGLTIQGEDPDHPVLVRHLLTHTSGLQGDFGQHMVWGFTVPQSTDEYLAANLKVNRLPEVKYEYSNTAFQLISKIIETASGKPYRKYIRDSIWRSLDMKDTAFVLRPDQYERLAIPYAFDERSSRQNPTFFLKANVWAAGMVYGTIHNQANWLRLNLNRGKLDSQQVVSEELFQRMMTTQFECDHFNFSPIFGKDSTIGLAWWLKEKDGETLFAHSGSIPGYTAWITGNLDAGIGIAILSNGNGAHPHLSKLAEDALQLMKNLGN